VADDPKQRDQPPAPAAIEVPYARLSPEVLRRVIEEFVTSEGTEYGRMEKSLETKVADVMRQLERGAAVILYDGETGRINIVPADPSPR